MNCPFCFIQLKRLDIVEGVFGPKAEYKCTNLECDGSEGKVFFSYLDSGELEW